MAVIVIEKDRKPLGLKENTLFRFPLSGKSLERWSETKNLLVTDVNFFESPQNSCLILEKYCIFASGSGMIVSAPGFHPAGQTTSNKNKME